MVVHIDVTLASQTCRHMHRSSFAALVAVVASLGLAPPVHALGLGLTTVNPVSLCNGAIAAAARTHAAPPGLLGAIGQVESGRRDPLTGMVAPWPWTIDVEGEGHLYDTEAEAIAAVRSFQTAGRRSIDVGCMQVNLLQHPDAFPTLEAAFDPTINARYAADLLSRLRTGVSDWMQAAGLYHSATPALAAPYRARVSAAMAGGDALGPSATMPAYAPPMLAMAIPPSGSPSFALRGLTASRPMPAGTVGLTGRSLASYRAAPVAWARPPNRVG